MRLFGFGKARRSGSSRPRRTVLAPRLRVTPLSNTSASVAWQFANSVDADQIVIQRSDDGVTYSTIATVTANSSGSYTDAALASDTCYWWRAHGIITYGSPVRTLASSDSNVEIHTTTDTTPALVQPGNLTVSEILLAATEYTISAVWDAVPNADGYLYYFVATTAGGFEDGDIDNPNTTVATSINDLDILRQPNDSISELHVMPVNGSGRGPETVAQVVIPGNLRPPILLPPDVTGNDVEISYVEDPLTTTAEYVRLERDDGQGFVLVAEIATGTPAPQYTDADLADGVYMYRVQALDNDALDEDGQPLEQVSRYSLTQVAEVNDTAPVTPDLGQDFETMGSLAALNAAFNITTPDNIVYDDGSLTPYNEVGLLYRYVAKPTKCNDQALFMEIDTPAQFEVWTEQTAVISTVFTTVNSNCTTIPNYKLSIGHIRPTAAMLTGRPRFEVHLMQGAGGRNMGATGTGYPTIAAEAEVINPNVFLAPTPIDATSLADGGRHVFRTYWKLFQVAGVWKETMILSVDDAVTHAWTALAGNPGTGSLGRLGLGGARSTGSEVESYICQKSYWVWNAGNNPGWFDGVIPTDYT